jgi:hypothetical protein
MIELRPFKGLGGADHGWLKAKHHFSFAGYYDSERMGWGAIRVWNDDEIAANTGFPPHPHADMEIITYVRQGAITHEDSLGNKGRTEAGDVQVMSAGRKPPAYSRSGSSRTGAAASPHGARSPFRKPIAPANSWCWQAGSKPIPRPCRSAPRRGC